MALRGERELAGRPHAPHLALVGDGEDAGEDLSQVTAAVRIEVVQGAAREFTLAMPDGLTVNQVEGATVADWNVVNGLLRVRLLDADARPQPAHLLSQVRSLCRRPGRLRPVLPGQ